MAKKGKGILFGAMSLGAGAVIAKLLGAVYRIPLTNLLGGIGLGLYQMVFPVYALLLDFSGAGVPNALAKVISEAQDKDKYKRAYEYLTSAVKFLAFIGAILATILFVLAKPLAKAQGNQDAYLGYVFLSPAIIFVAILSCFRGYFQGLVKMTPTAVSQIVEQFFKTAFGLALVYTLRSNVRWAVAGATLALTISEFFAVLYIYLVYRRNKRKLSFNFQLDKTERNEKVRKILKITIPITLVGIMLPLSQVIDSFMILNILGSYRKDATSLYGLLSGVVATVIGLPVSVCYGISTVAVPAVSGSKTVTEKDRNGAKTLGLTLAVSLPCAVLCYFLAPFIINLLFRSLGEVEKSTAINLLRVCSPCIVFLSFLQTGNAVLIGKGKPYMPVLSLAVGVLIKETLNFTLLKIPSINIYGGAIALIACYFTICLINLISTLSFKVDYESKIAYPKGYAN